MSEAISNAIEAIEPSSQANVEIALRARPHAEPTRTRTEWLIDNAEAYGPLLESLRSARRSVRIAQLAFDADCAAHAYTDRGSALSRDSVIAEALIELAQKRGVAVQILLNGSWILNTTPPLRRFFAARGLSAEAVEVRGMSRFPHIMHAKFVLIDEREAFLLGSPFVNSYWDDGGHSPFEPRRPARELGGRPLHDVSMRLRGGVVQEMESMFAGLWEASADTTGQAARAGIRGTSRARPSRAAGTRLVYDAPNGVLPGVRDGAMHMLAELLAGIARARDFIYVEHQYLTSRPIAAALATALRLVPKLEIVIVLNQNPDLTAYRAWQNLQLTERALLDHPRVGVFSLWSTDAHPERESVTRISQLFIHSKVMIVDDAWAAAGTSNLDGASMGDYGDDFAGSLGRRVFRGVRNVEINVIVDAHDAHDVSHGRNTPRVRREEALTILSLRERLWSEHLGVRHRVRPEGGWLAVWRRAALRNVRALSLRTDDREDPALLVGRVLPYSTRAFPAEQLADLGIDVRADWLELCYDPSWLSVYGGLHWVRNIF